ncbi:hypothetical protein D0C36_08960 [Mucilaginibacter conchicola]|uniref:Uncharacterized protein n=1 Tax=Mucilaginibacter conchicola TaxID=2303333 RepID=A0A372P134_9SPHI|nr:type VI secretion system tube protein TssD [Mucilaginibacter conchicola]RFZ95629.1 hypothetical protein D0C36_08960 [Mucilaginibacter conchicola]
MKKAIFLITSFAMLLMAEQTFAQSEVQTEEKKNKIVLTVMDGGKALNTDINSVSLSISRYEDSDEAEAAPEVKPAGKDTSKIKIPNRILKQANGISYLSIEAKSLSPELMKILAKSKSKFDGSITITDPATKKVIKSLKFKQASLYSYSDNFSALSDSYGYGSSVISINCKGLSIDGVSFD